MKSFTFAVLILAIAAAVHAQGNNNKPMSLETIDVENTLKNDKLVRRYIDCVLDKGRCDSNGKDLKDFMPKILKEKCSDCTPKVRENTQRIADFMKQNHPAEWAQISAKYSR